jgi:hypothetical protein
MGNGFKEIAKLESQLTQLRETFEAGISVFENENECKVDLFIVDGRIVLSPVVDFYQFIEGQKQSPCSESV